VRVDLGALGLADGGYLLVKRALRQTAPGESVHVTGTAEALEIDLRAWCRAEGHRFDRQSLAGTAEAQAIIVNGGAEAGRWAKAQRAAGGGSLAGGDVIAEHAPRSWGLAARGATIEAGAPEFDFHLVDKIDVWADTASHLYQQAVAAQWDPETVIPWNASFALSDDVEDAVVQVMTYLIENETAALIIPSRFIAQMHPHFREVMQILAIQAADEARHIEVFTRRARLKRNQLGLSTVGGQASLKTLIDEPEFAIASFLLSVLGEGTFLSLLWFIERYAPDPVTASVARLAAQDEARHVAFGLAHLSQHLSRDPEFRPRLADAVRRRHDALRHTAGLNDEVFDALLLMAAGSWEHDALRRGSQRLFQLMREMDEGRRKRLARLGFSETEAVELSALHTRNFM
jgi:TusA-related sulfurtransferase